MKDKLHKMMAKKRDLLPHEKKAKMDVVHDLRGVASDMLGDRMEGLKKVSVMSDSPEGLEAGLHKAHEIVSGSEEHQMQKDAEAPYSDYKHAIEEHQDEKGGNDMGYSEGGEVDESGDSDASDPEDEESEDESEDQDEFHGLDMDQVNEKLQKLMALKKQMESQSK